MSECCWDCFLEYLEPNSKMTRKDVILSDELELCEFCLEWKPIVVCYTRRYRFRSRWRDRRDAFRLLLAEYKRRK